jgi:hypothetical protein
VHFPAVWYRTTCPAEPRDHLDDVPALGGEGVPDGGAAAYLLGEDRGGDRAVAAGVAAAALLTRRVEEHRDRGQASRVGLVAPGEAAGVFEA